LGNGAAEEVDEPLCLLAYDEGLESVLAAQIDARERLPADIASASKIYWLIKRVVLVPVFPFLQRRRDFIALRY